MPCFRPDPLLILSSCLALNSGALEAQEARDLIDGTLTLSLSNLTGGS